MVEAKDYFNRADLYQIVQFLAHGKEDKDKKQATINCEKRIHHVSIDILEKMRDLNLEDEIYEKITSDIFQAFRTYEEVFTEIGLKIGARLTFQLFLENESGSPMSLQ